MVYFKIVEPHIEQERDNIFKKGIRFIFEMIFPKANPDFESKINLVAYWLLEFKDTQSSPQREIGLDPTGKMILKMPYRKNLGYWVDNSLKIEDFQRLFEIEEITKEEFEKCWAEG